MLKLHVICDVVQCSRGWLMSTVFVLPVLASIGLTVGGLVGLYSI